MRTRLVPAAALLAAGALVGWLASFTRTGTDARAQDKAEGKSVSRYEELANLPFAENRPTKQTAQTLRDELLFQRATQTYLWAMPLMNTLGMQVGSEKTFGAGYNVLPIWKKRLDAKTLVTTPNSDVLYAMSYVDLGQDGPVVMEAPPELQGILLDYWQRPIPVDGGKFFGDVGLFGPDAGKGGKFLMLPPGYKGDVPQGYYVYRSQTNNAFIFFSAFASTWRMRSAETPYSSASSCKVTLLSASSQRRLMMSRERASSCSRPSRSSSSWLSSLSVRS